jgi:hypothetical protein
MTHAETEVTYKVVQSRAPVARSCNPSYSGRPRYKDSLSKLCWRPYLEKNPSQKRADGMVQGVGPEFKPQYQKKKKVMVLLLSSAVLSSRLSPISRVVRFKLIKTK